MLCDSILNILSDESKWTKHASARDANEKPIRVTHEAACKWCINGAIWKSSQGFDQNNFIAERIRGSIHKLFPDRYHGTIFGFNDHKDTTFEDVVKVIKDACC
jgi:hypothetical protein